MTKLERKSVEPQRLPEAIPLQLESFLPYRLNRLASEVSQALASLYGARFGISIPEWRVLATLGQFETITAREIGKHSKMHKTTVSRAVAALEKRGLIRRQVNRTDMREAFLTMTDLGRATYFEIVPLARDFTAALSAPLSGTEADMLDKLLARLTTRIRDLTGGETAEEA